ncbi:MAG TPA: PQQ-binding-like beta-propeller repeat protein [Pirellulales bacterium]|nr:PQQ-binding-like beta-propeller repeat protein [Pirellulales bacterium]
MTRWFWMAGVLIAMTLISTAKAQVLEAPAGDWPCWRGPRFNGVAAAGPRAPVEWGESKNVAWKAPVPGRGHSSPTIVGNRVLLATADDQAQVQSVVCFDRKTGAQIWKRDVNQGGFPEHIHAKNTHATSTIASDGTRLLAAFLHHGGVHVVALDMNGKPIWQQVACKFTPDEYKNGYAASPLLYGDLVIVAGDYDGGDSCLVAFDRATGRRVWRTPRPERINYASPVVARLAGRDQLLISGCDIVAGYDPRDGKQLWKATATTMATAGTMVWDHDLVFASGGYPDAETVCIRADGSGKVVWRNKQKCYEQSMLAYEGHLYAVNDGGIAFCWDAGTGAERWHERLRGPMNASPVLSNGNMYAPNELGTIWVFRAMPERFELVAENQLGSEMYATPSICGGQVFLRVALVTDAGRQEMLYCLQNSK